MNLESSHKHAEQAPPLSDAPDETGYSQENGKEEPLASNGTSAGVPLDPEELIALLLGWLRTPDWLTSQKYLQAHAELLTEAAEQALLATLAESQIDLRAHQILTTHYLLLQTARQQGVDAAYLPFLHQEKGNNSMGAASFFARG
ncbi:hypothetical protein [Ktedonobacter robiniae]|uniref:Uncharacterized protein n=1 Tax=Ktedonobacter robiniae TaxID=2778365 RepID=A0ABQ3UTR5_9CHLR|nr:hypothetical protein [Ktedonobacter robiniae]GHO56224.1 hypothetical protein KSB_46990 [Ktedonobacter robiniae]